MHPELRSAPLSFVGCMGSAFRLWRSTLSHCWYLTLFAVVPIALVPVVAPLGYRAFLGACMLFQVGSALAYGALIATQKGFAEGKPVTFSQALITALSGLNAAIAATAVYGLMTILGLLIGVWPGIYILGKASLCQTAIFADEQGPLIAIDTSWRLTHSNWWRCAFTLSAALVIYHIFLFLVGFVINLIEFAPEDQGIKLAIIACWSGVVVVGGTPALASVSLTLYNDLKLRSSRPVDESQASEADLRRRDWLLASLRSTGIERPPRALIVEVIPPVFLAIAVGIPDALIFRYMSDALRSAPFVIGAGFYIIWITISIIVYGPFRVAIFRRIRRLRANSAEDELERSTKRPILYLRSFDLDAEVERVSWLERALAALLNVYAAPTAEENLARSFRKVGPFIAFGRPGEKLPALGAARFYVSHALWQKKVADVVRVSQFIVWMSGTTEGLRWELDYLVKFVAPERLLLWAHPHLMSLKPQQREAEWRNFLQKLGGQFPKALPVKLGEVRFFHFGPQFEPIPIVPNEYALGSPQADAMRHLLAAKGLRTRPRWFWRSDSPSVRYALGGFAGVFASLAMKFVVAVLASEPPRLSVGELLRAGLYGAAFVWLQPTLARASMPYLVAAGLFGLVMIFDAFAGILFELLAGTNRFADFSELLSGSVLLYPIAWGICLAVVLRLLPFGPGRPSKDIFAGKRMC